MIEVGKKYKNVKYVEERSYSNIQVICTDLHDPDYPVLITYDYHLPLIGRARCFEVLSEDGVSKNGLIKLEQVEPWIDLKLDDLAVVWNDNDPHRRVKAHFAGSGKKGKPKTFNAGKTSYTVKNVNNKSEWDHCEPYDPKKHNQYFQE